MYMYIAICTYTCSYVHIAMYIAICTFTYSYVHVHSYMLRVCIIKTLFADYHINIYPNNHDNHYTFHSV